MKRFLALLLALLPLAGCVTESRERTGRIVPPWPEEGAPAAVTALAEDLIAYRATTGKMPDDLAVLDASGIASGGPYAKHGYAYHPAGIGVLREGWRVIAADDRVRSAGKVWCVVRAPALLRDAAGLRTVLVPMPELRGAAVGENSP